MKLVLIAMAAALLLSLGLNFYALQRIGEVEEGIPTAVEDLDQSYPSYIEQLELAEQKIDALEEQVDDLETQVRNLRTY